MKATYFYAVILTVLPKLQDHVETGTEAPNANCQTTVGMGYLTTAGRKTHKTQVWSSKHCSAQASPSSLPYWQIMETESREQISPNVNLLNTLYGLIRHWSADV